MKLNFQKINILASSLLVAAMSLFVGCDEVVEGEDAGADYSEYITVSNIDPTFNTVKFDIKAESAVAIAYACVPADGEVMDAERVMEAGVKQGVNQGSYSIASLKSETDYKLYVVAQIPSVGIVGPLVKEFTTQINVGEPSSPRAAGIRAVDLGSSNKTNFTWEVTNGAQVDFSLSMVQPTIVMENILFEMAKTGVSKEEYLQSFMTTYGYLQVVTEGKGRSQVHNYTDRYTTLPIIPGANYTIYTLAFSGSYEDYAAGSTEGIMMLETTEVPVSTVEIPRIGNPGLKLETTETGYIHFRHKVTPNSDAKYWASYFTKKSEFDEFKKHYDELEGEGQGVKRLKEYVVHTDAEFIVDYVTDSPQSGVTEWPITVGWDQDEIEFSRLAVALDDNLVVGDDLEETLDKVIPQDNSEPADFTISVDQKYVGAESIFVRGRLGTNCAQAFWRAEAKGFFDEALADEQLSEALGRQLWDEGFAVHRNFESPSSYDPETDSFKEFAYDEFWNIYKPNTTYDLVAVGLNTTGGISKPEIVATFTTCDFNYSCDFDPFITITIPEEKISKTQVIAKYTIEPFDASTGEDPRITNREYFHVILEADDPVLSRDEQGIAQYLCSKGNCWKSISTQGGTSSFVWAALEPGTDYVYLYASLRGDGRVSRVGRSSFTTANNDGGPNPGFTISVKKEDVIENSADKRLYGGSYVVSPNGDVKGYSHLFFDEAALESYYVEVDDKAALEKFFIDRIAIEGLIATDVTTNSVYNTPKGKRMWAVAVGNGSEETNKVLSYVEFVMSSTGVVTINNQVDVKFTGESSTILPTAALPADISALSRVSAQQKIEKPAIKYVASPKKEFQVSDSSAETIRKETGIPVYSFLEISLKAALRGGESK